jgi:hypothetical protein
MFRLVLTFSFLILPLCAGDLSGRWSGTLRSDGHEVPLALEFLQADNKLSGACGIRADFLWPLRNVRLAGRILTFNLQLPRVLAGRFEGVVDGDRAEGQFNSDVAGLRATLVMKRIGPPSRLLSSFASPREPDDMAALSDEFENPGSLKNWKNLGDVERCPDRVEKIDVNKTSAGHLYIVPQSGAWWAGYHGIFLFKEVKGDFVITTRVKVTGKSGGEPANIWTISGLLLRSPASLTPSSEQRKENWIYVMTGRGPDEGRVVDAKSTMDSNNEWDITPAQPGWYELRIARLGPLFVAMCRADGAEWMLRKRIFRSDLPETLQAGINVTSDFKLSASMPAAQYNAELFPGKSQADSVTLFDYVRFSRVRGKPEATKLAGREALGISDADLLALFR